ncbi:MAG: carboxypeptidase regulatory-like domain-containing protein, partial [Oceanihabitans sp.]|nr:carboxypeptidase regulatory-like domain-containing protein [Oceanihabitans sp.]
MTKPKIYSLLFLFLSLISCTDEPIDFSISSVDPGGISPQEFLQNFGSNMEARFMGKVVNVSNEPISGVVVQVGNTTALTNDQGVFSVENVSVQEKFAYLKATKAGYIDGSRSLTPKEGVNLVEIM